MIKGDKFLDIVFDLHLISPGLFIILMPRLHAHSSIGIRLSYLQRIEVILVISLDGLGLGYDCLHIRLLFLLQEVGFVFYLLAVTLLH